MEQLNDFYGRKSSANITNKKNILKMDNLIPVNIVIGDRSYRIKVSAADEEQVRKTVKTINEKIVEFKTNFSGKDMQDYVAMVLVWYANETSSQNNKVSTETDEVQTTQSLTKVEHLIDQLLAQH